MAATHDRPFAVDLRGLSPTDTATMRTVSQQRYGNVYAALNPMDAYDILVHLPHVTPAEPDHAVLGRASREVREAFSRWRSH